MRRLPDINGLPRFLSIFGGMNDPKTCDVFQAPSGSKRPAERPKMPYFVSCAPFKCPLMPLLTELGDSWARAYCRHGAPPELVLPGLTFITQGAEPTSLARSKTRLRQACQTRRNRCAS